MRDSNDILSKPFSSYKASLLTFFHYTIVNILYTFIFPSRRLPFFIEICQKITGDK